MEVNGIGGMEQLKEHESATAERKRVFRYCPRALANLGLRTSVVIATILSIPDAFALLPGALSASEWMLKLIGCWTTALVTWFVFFVGMLHTVRIACGGVEFNANGFKLWRLGRLVLWSSVGSVSMEDQELFSKIFSFEPVARKMTICSAITGPFKAIVVPHQIPSFLFSEDEFTTMFRLAAQYGVSNTAATQGEGRVPAMILIAPADKKLRQADGRKTAETAKAEVDGVGSIADSIAGPLEPDQAVSGARTINDGTQSPRRDRGKPRSDEIMASVRKTYHLMNWQRVFVSILIAVGISMFLGRRTIVLYSYNDGLKCYRHRDFRGAVRDFKMAVAIEPSFAPAWHGLAGAEFNLGEFAQARDHWIRALFWKPDYVEAKVSLAYVSLQQRDFPRAEALVNSSLNLAPLNTTALLNRSDLNIRTGHLKEALQDARLVLTLNQGDWNAESYMATCLFAHAKLLQGRPIEASRIISRLPIEPEKLTRGENLYYRLLVGAEIFLALSEEAKAAELAEMALKRAQNVDSLLVMADVYIAEKRFEEARMILKRAIRLMPYNPWVYIKACQVNIGTKRIDAARDNLRSALECRPLDALSLSHIAELYTAFGEDEKAVSIARLSLRMEPVNPAAMTVIEHAVSRAEMVGRRHSSSAPSKAN